MKKIYSLLLALVCSVGLMWADRTFKLVTDVNDIDANGFYLFVQSFENNGTVNCLMGGYNSSSNRKGVEFTYQNELIVLQDAEIATSSSDADKTKAHVIKFVASSISGAWNIYDVADEKYLDGGYVNSQGKNQNHLKAVNEPTTAGSTISNDGHFNITIDVEGVATIQNQKNFVVRLNPNIQKGVASPIFASYPSTGTTGTNVKIYREIVAEVTVTTAQYATYYNASSAYVMPAGLEGITVEGVEGSVLTLNKTHYAAGTIVPADEPLILHATSTLDEATDFVLYAGETAASKVTENLLKGTSTAVEYTEGGNKYYRLSVHEGVVGFYYGAADGAAFQPGANKAYLAVSNTSAPAHFTFTDEVTAVENVEATETVKFMENGQLFIKKNGVIYNAMGQVVK